jgi:hypothetical protein
MARTWDPLIKSHAVKLAFSIKFFQPNQNRIIRDQMASSNKIQPNADLDWQIDASEACATDDPSPNIDLSLWIEATAEPSQHACPSETTPGRSFAAVVAWKEFG